MIALRVEHRLSFRDLVVICAIEMGNRESLKHLSRRELLKVAKQDVWERGIAASNSDLIEDFYAGDRHVSRAEIEAAAEENVGKFFGA